MRHGYNCTKPWPTLKTMLNLGVTTVPCGCTLEGIVSLNGVQHLTTLTSLEIRTNQRLSDLALLAQLPALTTLSLNDLPGVDLAPLAQLPALTTLSLNNLPGVDLALLAQLPALTTLWLDNLPGVDLALLAQLPALTTLWLDNLPGVDLALLAQLPALTDLRLDNLPGVDLAPVEQLPMIRSLGNIDLRLPLRISISQAGSGAST